MSPELAQNLPLIIGAAVVLLIAIFVFMRLNRRSQVVRDENSGKDVLDEGAAPAARNQALIDAPKAVANNFGEQSAVANADKIAAAGANADAGQGDAIAARLERLATAFENAASALEGGPAAS